MIALSSIVDNTDDNRTLSFTHSNAKRMPIDVQDALRVVCVRHGGLSEEEAASFITRLEASRKLQLETWA